MATQDRAALVKSTIEGVRIMTDTAATIEAGVFVKRATVGGAEVGQKATATADGATLLGVSQFRTPLPKGEPGGPEEPDLDFGTLLHSGVFGMNGRAAETYQAFDYLVIDTVPGDGQSVRLYDPGGGDLFEQIVGVVWPGIAGAGIAGGSFNIPVWLAPTALGRNNRADALTLV